MSAKIKFPNIKDAILGAVEGLGNTAANIITKFKADPTKALEYEKELEQARLNATLEADRIQLDFEKEVTKRIESENNSITARWQADMNSDSWLSKNTRPIVLLSLLGFLFVLVFFDSAIKERFEVKDAYIELVQAALETAMIAYFGSRGMEKYMAMKSKKA